MTDGSGFCTKCGTPFKGQGQFCTSCGATRSQGAQGAGSVTPAPVASAPAPTPTPTAAPVASVASTASVASFAGAVAGTASMAAGLPWQTIVAGQTPDLSAMLSRAAMPAAQKVVRRSLRRPGLSMAATTVLDLFVAGISGGPVALAAAVPRALGGGLTSLLSMITGTKGGALRGLTGAVSLITALVQVVSLGGTLIGGFADGAPLLSLLPMAIAMGSALIMALKTASVALRRRS